MAARSIAENSGSNKRLLEKSLRNFAVEYRDAPAQMISLLISGLCLQSPKH